MGFRDIWLLFTILLNYSFFPLSYLNNILLCSCLCKRVCQGVFELDSFSSEKTKGLDQRRRSASFEATALSFLTCDGIYAPQMRLLIPDHQFLCSHVLLFLFRPPGQLQLDLIRLRLRFVDGPGPWRQMVDYPTKPTQDPPPVPGCCWKQQKSQQPDLPTVGQLAPQTAHTLGPSNFLASFPSLPSFLFYFLL